MEQIRNAKCETNSDHQTANDSNAGSHYHWWGHESNLRLVTRFHETTYELLEKTAQTADIDLDTIKALQHAAEGASPPA
jgi:hypothetical protein